MKKLVLLVALVAVLAIVAACAPAPTAVPTAAPPTAAPKASSSSAAPSSSAASSAASSVAAVTGTITIWNGYHTGDNEEKALNQLLDAAKKVYPDAKINVLEIPFDQLFNKFETEAATGGGPDMYIAPNDSLGKEARAGLLAPLDDLLKGKLDAYSPLSVQGVTVDGKIYAVPMIPKALAMYYNKTTVATPPATTDDLLAAVKAGKKVGIPNSGYHTFGWWRAFGGSLMDNTGKCTADQGGVADAYTYLMSLKAAGAQIRADTDLDTLYRQGQLDIYFNGPWVLGGNEDALGKDKVGVAPMPKGPKGNAGPLTGIDGWYINVNSKNKTSAVNLALFLANKDGQTAYANVAGDPPARTDVTTSDPNVKAFADAANAGFPRPLVPQLDNFWGPFGDAATKIFEGTAKPADAINAACADMNKANKIAVTPASSSSSSAVAVAPTAVPTPGKPLKIGLLTDQTGALAIYGPMLENGFAIGLDYATKGTNTIAGRPIQIITKDTASKADVGTQVARDLIEKDNVDVLVGVPSSGVALAVAELANQYKKIYIAQPAASPDLTGKNFNPYVFRTSRTSDQDSLASAAALAKLGKNFVQIAPDYAFGYGSATGFYNVVKAGGGKFAVNDSADKAGAIYIPQDAKDFTPYLQKVLDTKADVLIVTWAGAGFVPLFTQMQQLGVFKAMAVYTGMGDNQTLKSGYSFATGSQGLIVYHYTLPKNPINDLLVKNSQDKYKTVPDLFTEGGFTAAQMLVAGLTATNGDPNPTKLIPVFEKLSFDGPKGKYTVRDYDHVLLQTMYVVKLTNTDNPDFKFFDLGSELKPEDTAPTCQLVGEYASRCPKK